MILGKALNETYIPLTIDADYLDYVTHWKYLGTTLAAGPHLSFSARPDITSFFRATNSVLNVLSDAPEQILLALLHTNCVPILTYACAVKEYSASDMSDCNVAVNNACRKIFGFKDWRSIRTLREMFGFKSIYILFHNARDKFLNSCHSHRNPIIRFLSTLS